MNALVDSMFQNLVSVVGMDELAEVAAQLFEQRFGRFKGLGQSGGFGDTHL